jgi:hypothetical protein
MSLLNIVNNTTYTAHGSVVSRAVFLEADKVLVASATTGGGFYSYVLDVQPDGSVVKGTSASTFPAPSSNLQLVKLNSTTAVALINDMSVSSYVTAIVLTVSGSTVSHGTKTVIHSLNYRDFDVIRYSDNSFIYSGQNSSAQNILQVVEVNGGVITQHPEYINSYGPKLDYYKDGRYYTKTEDFSYFEFTISNNEIQYVRQAYISGPDPMSRHNDISDKFMDDIVIGDNILSIYYSSIDSAWKGFVWGLNMYYGGLQAGGGVAQVIANSFSDPAPYSSVDKGSLLVKDYGIEFFLVDKDTVTTGFAYSLPLYVGGLSFTTGLWSLLGDSHNYYPPVAVQNGDDFVIITTTPTAAYTGTIQPPPPPISSFDFFGQLFVSGNYTITALPNGYHSFDDTGELIISGEDTTTTLIRGYNSYDDVGAITVSGSDDIFTDKVDVVELNESGNLTINGMDDILADAVDTMELTEEGSLSISGEGNISSIRPGEISLTDNGLLQIHGEGLITIISAGAVQITDSGNLTLQGEDDILVFSSGLYTISDEGQLTVSGVDDVIGYIDTFTITLHKSSPITDTYDYISKIEDEYYFSSSLGDL